MGDLIESDPELYQADEDEQPIKRTKGNGDLGYTNARLNLLDRLYGDSSDHSLMSEDEQNARVEARKARETKLNNSFTGPYPQDPTDFNHTDKGPNAQFLHYLQKGRQAAGMESGKSLGKKV